MSEAAEPYLLVEKCGSERGVPIYVITKHTPSAGGYPSRTREIRCMDLGAEAMGTYEGGCTYIQFKNELNDFRCTGCHKEFSKYILRQSALIEIKELPD